MKNEPTLAIKGVDIAENELSQGSRNLGSKSAGVPGIMQADSFFEFRSPAGRVCPHDPLRNKVEQTRISEK